MVKDCSICLAGILFGAIIYQLISLDFNIGELFNVIWYTTWAYIILIVYRKRI